MSFPLRIATSANVSFGPFVDKSNAVSAETGITPSVAASKNGAAYVARASGNAVAHDQQGWFRVPLNSVDVNTAGRLRIMAMDPNVHLAVWDDFTVMTSAAYSNAVTGGLVGVGATQADVESARADLATDIANKPTIASVSTAVQNNILNYHLDHVAHTSAPAGVPVSNTITQRIMGGGFDPTTDALQDIRDRGDAAWITATGFGTPANIESAKAETLSGVESARADLYSAGASNTTDLVWDRLLQGNTHNITNSAGKRLRQVEQSFVLANGTIAAVTNGHTLTLDAGAVATADFYHHARLQIIEGTGAGQSRIIVGYTSGRVVTLDSDFEVNPDTSSLYEVVAADVHVSTMDLDLAAGFVAVYTNTTTITLDSAAVGSGSYYVGERIVFTHGVGEGQSRDIIAYTSGRVVTLEPALLTPLDTTTVYHIVAATTPHEIWEESQSEHVNAGTMGGQMSNAALGGGVTIGSIGTQVWHYSLSAGMVVGQAGFVLRSAAANAGVTTSGAVSSTDISNITNSVWNKARSAHVASGSFGQGEGIQVGSGGTAVDHDTGGTDNLRLVDDDNAAISDADIRVYLKSNWDSGLRTVGELQGQTTTKDDGRWNHEIYLDSGVTYTIVYTKTGSIETTTKELTV